LLIPVVLILLVERDAANAHCDRAFANRSPEPSCQSAVNMKCPVHRGNAWLTMLPDVT
jgi:hypothetical protein